MQASGLAQMSLFMSRSAERMHRHHDAFAFLRKVLSFNTQLLSEKRDLFKGVLKDIMLCCRDDITFLDTVIVHQMGKACLVKVEAVQTYRAQVFREMSTLAFESIGICARQLIPASHTIDAQVC
jgi:hypothetical protein